VRIEGWKLGLGAALVLALLMLSVPWGADLGWAYLADRQYELAREMFAEALRGEPTDANLWLGLATAYEALGDPARQIATLEDAARALPRRRDLLVKLADAHQANRDPAAAAAVIERLTVHPGPEDAPLLERLLTAYLWKGDYERQVAVLRKLLALSPTDADVVQELAAVARSLNRQEEAVTVLEGYVRRRPGDPEGRRWLAQIYDSLGQGDRALEHWRVLAQAVPGDVEARDRLLPAPGGAPRVEEIALLERQRAADPRDEAARRRLVDLYRAAGDGPRAIGAQQELAALRPRDPDALVLLGRLLVEQDRGPAAIAAYERAVEIAPDRLETALALAQLYEWSDEPRRALALLDRVAKARPADRALQERVAALAQGSDDGPAALAALDRLAALAPQDGRYARQAVDALVAANRLPEAIARQGRIAAQSPGAPDPALRLAQLHEWNNQEREAITVYEGLDRAGALPEPALGRLAELYRFQDRPADFLRVADRLLARRPDDWALRDAAAQAAEGLARPQDAVRLLQPAAERRPLDEAFVLRYLALTAQAGRADDGLRVHRRFAVSAGPGYRAKAGRVLMELGRYPDAVTEYEAALAAAPGAGDDAVATRLALAQLYDWTGAAGPALRQWESLMRARPRDPRMLREVGRRSLAVSRNDVALRAYRSLLDVLPDDAEALKRAGQLMAWSQDARGARAALERFNRVKGGDYEVHYLLGELYTADRDEERARLEYERALRLLPARADPLVP
jgi:tetratricopeptide (TPR) repeat protein